MDLETARKLQSSYSYKSIDSLPDPTDNIPERLASFEKDYVHFIDLGQRIKSLAAGVIEEEFDFPKGVQPAKVYTFRIGFELGYENPFLNLRAFYRETDSSSQRMFRGQEASKTTADKSLDVETLVALEAQWWPTQAHSQDEIGSEWPMSSVQSCAEEAYPPITVEHLDLQELMASPDAIERLTLLESSVLEAEKQRARDVVELCKNSTRFEEVDQAHPIIGTFTITSIWEPTHDEDASFTENSETPLAGVSIPIRGLVDEIGDPLEYALPDYPPYFLVTGADMILSLTLAHKEEFATRWYITALQTPDEINQPAPLSMDVLYKIGDTAYGRWLMQAEGYVTILEPITSKAYYNPKLALTRDSLSTSTASDHIPNYEEGLAIWAKGEAPF